MAELVLRCYGSYVKMSRKVSFGEGRSLILILSNFEVQQAFGEDYLKIKIYNSSSTNPIPGNLFMEIRVPATENVN